ncbi:hypothetical protein Leryth_011337 [Lithospermum erythrorhizon]|nr:hypothetical protein Leryth_011337 [Lithospermum erythrorhizon]
MSEAEQQDNTSSIQNSNEDQDHDSPEQSEQQITSSSSDSDSDDSSSEPEVFTRRGDIPDLDSDDEASNTPSANFERFRQVLDSKRLRKERDQEDKEYTYLEDLYNFPKDKENWREEDLKELWGDAPYLMTKPGWDPKGADDEEVEIIENEIEEGREVPIAPFYVPYRKSYPVIPDNHHDISNPKSVVEELDRIEEFLTWVSYIFPDGSSYEGTVWDDLAHGKGVYVAEHGLVRYEGEWLRNDMEGHGVVEVEIPNIEPVPGSKLEEKMRAEGKIIKRDFMSPEDREWLEMDIEDSMNLAQGNYEIPFYENEEWIKLYGEKPEKGRYRYAGEWKHGRMHGCGLYQVNERPLYGRFYFGELLEKPYGCDADISAMHAGLAEVAAAKARMFINKPDGMVREERGPYSDPQHPYLYEEEDVWMAPGFINQFYEVPDYWKTYVSEVDQEREMWLNSFYRSPLRLPMPAELEYWWEKDEKPEFILINKEPEPDPEDPTKLIYTEDPLILHTPTGRIINYVDDEEYGIRLFWQPPLKEGEDVDPDKAEFLPLGFDEFYGREVNVGKDNVFKRLITSIESASKPMFEKLEKWSDEKKEAIQERIELIKKEMELAEAEQTLNEAIEDLDEELKRLQKEEEKKVELGFQEEGEEDAVPSEPTFSIEEPSAKEEEDEDEDEGDDDDDVDAEPSSFGSADFTSNDKSQSKNGKSPFAATSLSLVASSLLPIIPAKLHRTFTIWKQRVQNSSGKLQLPLEECTSCSISFPSKLTKVSKLRAVQQVHHHQRYIVTKSFRINMPNRKSCQELQRNDWGESFNILSLHTPLPT